MATERAPFVFTGHLIDRAFARAEREGGFKIDEVSPADAARAVRAATLVVHGRADVDTPPEHARRIYASLAGPKRLLLVDGARHNESLRADV